MRLKEDLDMLKMSYEYRKVIILESISDIKDRVTFMIENYKGNIKLTEVYPWDTRLYMDNIAFERLSTMIFWEFVDFVHMEDMQWLLVYLQKKYSENFIFRNILLDQNTELYASDQADVIASQMIQLFIDDDEKNYDDEKIQKQERAKFYYEIWLLYESEYQKVQEEFLGILDC